MHLSSLRTKILTYFLLLTFIPFLTLGILGPILYSNSIEEETNRHTEQTIAQATRNAEFYVHDMENIIGYIVRSPAVIPFFASGAGYDREAALGVLRIYKEVHPEIAGILLVNRAGDYASDEMEPVTRDPLTMEPWYSRAVASPGRVALFSKPIGRNIRNRADFSADEVVSIVKCLEPDRTGSSPGVILIDMKLSVIKDVLENITLVKSGFLFLKDPDGSIVYTPTNPIVYRVRDSWLAESDSVVKPIGSTSYQIMSQNSAYTGWKTVGVFSLNEAQREVTYLRYYTLMTGGITILIALILSLFFTSSITRPIIKLQSLMKQAEEGDLDVRFRSPATDEIGKLGHSFNAMIEELKKLIDLVYKEQQNKREAELRILQEQIKPHFLYNTLDTIQWMAQAHGADDIMTIVGALTTMFRLGLSKGREIISLEEEIGHIRSYLIIQSARYPDKFRYEIEASGSLLKLRVLRLIMQPLVENAIYHGIKEKRGPGTILIKAEKTDGRLVLSVRDSGIGMSGEKLAEIEAILASPSRRPEESGYGIYNVNERIRLSFGKEFGLRFESVHGEGTTAYVDHPVLEPGE
jgi:two-component system, sensor histidine kinase YesM